MPTMFITGGNRGLGLEFVSQYLGEGWQVIASCRDPENAGDLAALKQSAGGQLEIEALDVTDQTAVKRLAEKLGARTIDLLINNAGTIDAAAYGTAAYDDVDDPDPGTYDFDEWRRVMDTNLLGPIAVTSAFVPHLERAENAVLVMMGSGLSSIANNTFPGRYTYRTSKAALNTAMRGIALWLVPKNITTVTISPGWTKTGLGGPNAQNTVDMSVKGMRKVIANLNLEDAGRFINFDGSEIPW